jgi:hypothetical protein
MRIKPHWKGAADQAGVADSLLPDMIDPWDLLASDIAN